MTASNTYEYRNPIRLTAATADEPALQSTVVFRKAPEKAQIGQPGKQAGDIMLVRTAEDTAQIVVSLGTDNDLSPESYRKAGGSLARWLKKAGANRVDIDQAELNALASEQELYALLEGLLLGGFEFRRHKSTGEEADVEVVLHSDSLPLKEAIERAEIIASSVNMARDWAHEPANIINPVTMAERVQTLGKQYGLKVTVLDEKQLAQLNAGGLLNVGRGSKTPPRLIIIEYPGTDTQDSARPVPLVGKAITFDTGGYSLKGVEHIVGMKSDKTGGVLVAAALIAAARLKLKGPVVGLIAAAENMISEDAYRPDDIIRMMSGKTVEIISTDAEGRLVLADALAYAQKEFNPKALIDLATLTGGVVTALGRVRAGVMTNNQSLFDQLQTAGDAVREKLWQLPLDEEYFEAIKSDDADIKNSGGREAHPIMGGIFLKQFVSDDVPWAHIDIAGVSGTPKDLPYTPKGATGFGVRLLLRYLESLEG